MPRPQGVDSDADASASDEDESGSASGSTVSGLITVMEIQTKVYSQWIDVCDNGMCYLKMIVIEITEMIEMILIF